MRPAKAVLSPIALTLFVLLAARLAPGGMQVTHKGCDLPFQAGVSFVVTDGGGYATIDMTKWNDAALIQDSNGCVDPLLDYPNAFNPNPNATACNVVPKSLGHVKIYSKRDDGGKFMYLLFDVDDQTIPTNQVLTALGDRIIIQLDTKPSGAKSLTPATFRLDYVVPRGSPGTGSRLWYKGSTTNQTATWTQGTPPAALAIAGGDRPDASGYRVAFQIPLADATVGYDLAANNQFPDFGIAIAIVNDIGCFDPNSDPQNPGVTYEMLTGAAFPGGIADAQNPNSLTISNFTDPMLTDLSSITPEPNASPEDNWFNPSLWATGTFKGAGDSVYITHDSNFYTSDDIKTTYCNVANFADVIGPGQKNSNWYQYFAGAPCALGTFAQFRVHTAAAQPIRRRVIFFWAESGMNIPQWNFVRLTAPITLNAGELTAQTPPCPWTSVPSGLKAHPCVRVLILPESLTDAVWSEAFLRGLTSIPDSGGPNGIDLAGLRNAYSITDAQMAQMNIEWSDTAVPCPPAASCQPCSDTVNPGGDVRFPGEPAPPGRPPAGGPIQPHFLRDDRPSPIRPAAYQQRRDSAGPDAHGNGVQATAATHPQQPADRRGDQLPGGGDRAASKRQALYVLAVARGCDQGRRAPLLEWDGEHPALLQHHQLQGCAEIDHRHHAGDPPARCAADRREYHAIPVCVRQGRDQGGHGVRQPDPGAADVSAVSAAERRGRPVPVPARHGTGLRTTDRPRELGRAGWTVAEPKDPLFRTLRQRAELTEGEGRHLGRLPRWPRSFDPIRAGRSPDSRACHHDDGLDKTRCRRLAIAGRLTRRRPAGAPPADLDPARQREP